MENEIINVKQAIALVSNENTFNKMLLNFHQTVIKEKIQQLNQYIKEKDWFNIRFVGHQYKGTCSYIAANRLADACYKLQLLSDQQKNEINPGLVYKYYVKVVQETQSVEEFICKRLKIPRDESLQAEYEFYKTFEYQVQKSLNENDLINKLAKKDEDEKKNKKIIEQQQQQQQQVVIQQEQQKKKQDQDEQTFTEQDDSLNSLDQSQQGIKINFYRPQPPPINTRPNKDSQQKSSIIEQKKQETQIQPILVSSPSYQAKSQKKSQKPSVNFQSDIPQDNVVSPSDYLTMAKKVAEDMTFKETVLSAGLTERSVNSSQVNQTYQLQGVITLYDMEDYDTYYQKKTCHIF